MNSHRGFCHLCRRKNIELHKKSHIIPKFMFEDIFGKEGPRIIHVDPETLEEVGSAADAPYDKYIFCVECEKNQSALESKASHILYHKKLDPNNIFKSQGTAGKQLFFKAVILDDFKRFLLLLLWRADISTHKIFRGINLGPYTEKFRQVILKEANTSHSNCQFHIFNFKYVFRREVQHFCTPFFRLKISGRNAYCIFIDGVGYLYHFGKPDNKVLEVTKLESNNGLRVNLPNRKTAKELIKMFQIKNFNLI